MGTYYGLITNSRMEHGPSVEDLIHSIHQDVFNQEDNYSPMYGTNSPVSTNQYPQNGLWNVSAVTNTDFQSGNQMLHQDVNFQSDRPQTPYFTPHSSQVVVHSPGETLRNRLQPQSNFTTTVHEEVTFTPPLSTNSQQNGGILYNPGVRSAENAVTSQPSSPRDGQFAPQPPLEPRKSRTRSSIRRAAKLLLNRSKQVLSNSDSNISSPSSSTPVPPGKDAKKNAGSPSVKERLNKNRARMGELLKNSKWKEKRQSSEEKENRYAINSNASAVVSKPRQKARVRHVNDHRRFHSAENINASVLSSDSSHYSGSDVNDCSSNYMDDVSFDGNSGGAGYALRRYNSGPIQQERQRQRDHHRGYHTADSDTDSSISRGDLHYMAVQNRFGSGRQVKSTREALKKLNRNRSFNGQHSQLGGTPKHTPAGPLKADHTIQPFIHNDRLQDSCLQDQWKEQGARPKYSSTESLETESVNHEVFPDTAIRSDSEDHRGSRSSLVGRHSRTASPCRSVHFEDEEVRRSTNGDLPKAASFNSDYHRTLSENEGDVSDYVRYGRRHSENGRSLRDRGTVVLHDGSVGDVFINGGTDSDPMDHVQRHRGHARERSERSSRRSQSVNGVDHRNIGSGSGAMDNGYDISSTIGGRYDNNSGANSSGLGREDRSNSEVREDGISIREEGERNGRVDLRTPRSRSPFVKSSSHDGHYPSEGRHVNLGSGGVTEEAANGDKIQNDNLDRLQGAIEPEYEEIKRAKKTYSTHANSYYDAIQAHSAWDEYKRKLQEEKDEEKRRAGPFTDMSSFSRNQDHLSKMSGSNLSIASNSSISEKMQHLGHATKQTFGRMRRALSLDKINRNSQKDDGFDKESKLKRSPSLRSMSSFFGRKKDKLMGSFSDLSSRERPRRSASISGPSSAVMEQIDVTTPSYMRKIGRVLEVYDDGTRLVRLVKPPNGPFGFYIAKGASTNGPGIFVKRIGDGHPAKILAGLLQVGDEILEINGHNVKIEKNIDTVYDLILDNDDLVLRVRPLDRRGTELS